jgi:uncharacterized caspase-like protein
VAGTVEKRVALVIGNAAYEHAEPLKTPVNDARAIGSALSRLGFSGAKPQFNLDYIGFRRALRAFGAEAEGADIAAVYFAGHGIEVDGRNFLIPTDAQLQRARDVDFATVPLDQVLAAAGGTQKLNLVIIDACRNNPFRVRMLRSGGTRSIGRGLHSIALDGNALVAYAAKHGTYALNGNSSSSPYAEALLAHIERPGIEVVQLFREVRNEVLERTDREQEPHLYGTLGRCSIYLRPVPPRQPVISEAPNSRLPPRSRAASLLSFLKPWMVAVAAALVVSTIAISLALWLGSRPTTTSAFSPTSPPRATAPARSPRP